MDKFICGLRRLPVSDPGDTTELQALLDNDDVDPIDIVAIFGKTEGNGCVNDHTRGYATTVLKGLLEPKLGTSRSEKISYVMSGGTEGVISPHLTVFTRRNVAEGKSDPSPATPSLSISVTRSRALRPHEIGRLAQIRVVAEKVREAMKGGGVASPDDVHLVQVKCPLVTSAKAEGADSREPAPISCDAYKTMAFSRGASAIGVALALEEISEADIKEGEVLQKPDLYSRVASCSAGSEIEHCEVVLLANSPHARGRLFALGEVMADALDHEVVDRAWSSAREKAGGPVKLIQLFAKAEADPSGNVRGRRHVMLDDSDINHTRHARAVVGAVLAAKVGDPMLYISGGAEHQGPPGGGPVCFVFER